MVLTCIDEENGLFGRLSNIFVVSEREKPSVENDSNFESRIFGKSQECRSSAKRVS